ncbi:MAG TPA: hypothetical protein VIO95_09665, partial [Mycobacterium sp.]
MADPIWFGPPEAVAALLELSDPSTIAANIAAWLAEVIQHELSMGLSVANIGATLEQWVGLGGAAYGMKGSELNFLGLEPLAAHCLKHVAIGQSAVEADSVARSAVIPSGIAQGNRDEFGFDNAINWLVLGALSPRIAELEGEYTEYWGQNTGVAVVRANILNTLVGAIGSTPPPITPPGASPAIASAPAQVAETAAEGATQAPSTVGDLAGEAASPAAGMGDQLSSFMGPAQGLMSGVTQPFQSLASLPPQGFQGLSSSIQPLMSAFTSMSPQNAGAAEAAGAEAVGASLGGGGAAGGIGAGAGGGATGISSSAAGLTSFTRPTSTFEPETAGGRATGLRPGGVLNAADLRGPTTTAGMG